MRNMLSNTDSLKNQTLMLDNLKLKISNGDYPFSGHKTSLMWYRVINGCEYLELSLGFTDGVFTGLRDNREITPIGNTNVNVSKEQAIAIAMKYIENYTYEMPGDVWITGFNVTENRVTAVLHPTERVSMLYPAWNVMLYLDHTYLGGVEALFVIVWADSGEVLLCNNQAYGGGAPSSSDNGNVVILPSPSPSLPSSPSPSASPEASVTSLSSNTTTAIVAVAAIAVTVALITIFVKKRSKHHHLAFFSILLRATDLKFKL